MRDPDGLVEITLDADDNLNCRRCALIRLDDDSVLHDSGARDFQKPLSLTFAEKVRDTHKYRIDVPPGKYLVLLIRTDLTLANQQFQSVGPITADHDMKNDSSITNFQVDEQDRQKFIDWLEDPDLNVKAQKIVKID